MLKLYTYFLFLIIFFGADQSFAQKEKNIWYFGNKAGVDFNSGIPVALQNSQMNVWEGCASIADRNTGQLLFYTDGDTVWDRNNIPMPNGIGLFGHWSSTQSALIVPIPGDSNKYYIFTTYNEGYIDPPNKGLNYSIVDMCLREGKGDVTVKNVHLLDNASEKLTGVPHSNGKDFWIIGHTLNTNDWYVYKVSDTGIAPPIISSIGDKHYSNISQNATSGGYLKVSPNGKKLFSVCQFSCKELFDFDESSGKIFDVIPLDCSSGGYGGTFSPDNSKLYFCGLRGIAQYDLSSNDSITIIHSEVIVAIKNEMYGIYKFGTLQLGPDHKIYASTFTHWLGRINDPDSLGLKCNFDSTAVDLGTGISQFGLPNFMDSYTDTGGIGGHPCFAEPTGSFDVFPNPSSSHASAIIYMPMAKITLELYDVLGKKVMDIFSGNLSIDAQQIDFDIHDLSSGSYFLRLQYPGGVTTRQLEVIK
jgi:hypothetical protein